MIEGIVELGEFLRSLGFGGLLGSGLLGIIYLLFPGLFPATVSIEIILVIGGLSGAGFHGLFEKLVRIITKKLPDELEDFRNNTKITAEKLQILQAARDCEYISDAKASEIREKLLINLLLDKIKLDDISSLSLEPGEE